MSDWLGRLTPAERAEWDEIVQHARTETYEMISKSAMVISMVTGKTDVKFALELGLAIMLDKPILAVTVGGAPVPAKLRLAADEVIELTADPDTGEGAAQAAAAIERITGRLGREGNAARD